MLTLQIWQFWFCLFEQAMYVSTCTRCKTCEMCTKLVFVWQRAKFPRCAKWGSPGVCEMCAESLSNPFLLPCLVPLPSASDSAWHRDSSPIKSNARFNSFWFFAQMVHMSCPVWCTCLPVCDSTAGISDHLKPARVPPRVWAPPSLQNWPQPSPPHSPPHCPIVQASPTFNWVLQTFSR